MANIELSDLQPAGSELFQDSESYLNELGESEVGLVQGGRRGRGRGRGRWGGNVNIVVAPQVNVQFTVNVNNQQFSNNNATTFQNTANFA